MSEELKILEELSHQISDEIDKMIAVCDAAIKMMEEEDRD